MCESLMSVQEVEERRKLFASSTGRSVSAPPRKKWYKRVPYNLRRIGSQQNILQDQLVSRRLVGAITMWHDIHANLLQLSIDRSSPVSSDSSDGSSTTSSCESLYIDEEETQQANISKPNENFKEDDSHHESECMDMVHEIRNIKSNTKINGKMSISNPELTSVQLKAMFPELSDHWSLENKRGT
ncbi:hypothetical protein L596_003023 [Steinernema carpocapsae]|uniref:Uncharacterized protein n=1 Tax=Steinernema carpocapsae TaxID=34508 RepID=A0A4U8UV35_STECR|nr:hypothetical protein L596_003023 [Steinernema carpocapsae]